jgi:hypothetical protein
MQAHTEVSCTPDLQLLEGLMRGLGSCPHEALRILRDIHTTAAAIIPANASFSNSSNGSGSNAHKDTATATAVAVVHNSSGVSVDNAELYSSTAAVTADAVLHLWLLLLESR